MISFNVPPRIGTEQDFILKAIENHKICGDGEFTKKCSEWIKNKTGSNNLLTTSCSSALDMSAILANIKPGDEVITSSFTFVSTVNAFALRGAKIIFVDIRPDTMNIDENLIEEAITEKTKVIIPVHYAGVACEMDTIIDIAKKHNLLVVEDAAQGVMSEYKGKSLGAIGDMGCYSFHETKNYSMGEGGAILIKNPDLFSRAEIIREKGTDRSKYFRGQVDKYQWVDIGSSYLPSELNAAYLYAQLLEADKINNARLFAWNTYFDNLSGVSEIELPTVPVECKHNAHMFYIKAKDLEERTRLIDFLAKNDVNAVFHYVPLHTSKAGKKYSVFCGEDKYATKESERLVRLPLWYGISEEEVKYVCGKIKEFYSK